jgi:hypothetical protein
LEHRGPGRVHLGERPRPRDGRSSGRRRRDLGLIAMARRAVLTTLEAFGRTPIEQATASLQAALRALDMVTRTPSDLCPHPLDTVRAEINQAIRDLGKP